MVEVPEAERVLGVRLPADYVAFLEIFGAGYIGDVDSCVSQPCGNWGVVAMTAQFRKLAPEHFMPMPAGWRADSLIQFDFEPDGFHHYWLVTGEDSDHWPVVQFEEGVNGDAWTVLEGGFVDVLLRRWAPVAGSRDREPVPFMHWRKHDRLAVHGHFDSRTGLPFLFE